MRKNYQKPTKIILGLLFAILLIYYLLKQISIKDIAVLFHNLNMQLLIVAFLFYVGSYFFRALRFKITLNTKLKLTKLFHVVSIHTVMNNLMPARLGELSYIYLAKKQGIKGTTAISSLIAARVFDLIVISLIFLVSVILIKKHSQMAGVIYLILLLLALLLLFLVISIILKHKVLRMLNYIARKLNIKRAKAIKYILIKLSEASKDLDRIKSKKILLLVFFSSIAVWICQFLTLYLIVISSGVRIGLLFLIVSITFSTLSTILPIYSPGGFGTIEGSWALGLVILGVSKEIAISTGFFQHIILIIFFAVLGFFSLAYFTFKK